MKYTPKYLETGINSAGKIEKSVNDDWKWKTQVCNSMKGDAIRKSDCKSNMLQGLMEEYYRQLRRCANNRCYNAIMNKINKLNEKWNKTSSGNKNPIQVPVVSPPPIPANVLNVLPFLGNK